MKKALIIALSTATFGCQAVPEKPPVDRLDAPAVAAAPTTVTASATDTPEAATTPVTELEAAVEPAIAEAAQPEAPLTMTPASLAPMTAEALAKDPRMDKVVKLIHSSSGARQVESSDNPEAAAFHGQAKALYQQALEADSKSEASRLLDEAVKTMYAAIRTASPSSLSAEKHQRDFDKLQRSVDTFLEQHQRISDEKGNRSEGLELRTQVNTLVQEAERTFAAGDTARAQTMLREAFEMLRNDLQLMRGGETLVRSLNFASKKEEYDYELARYKSQRMLVDVLLREKMQASAYVKKQITQYIKVAEQQRGLAESQAADGDYTTALEALGVARKQIVRSLRTGGIYVPG